MRLALAEWGGGVGLVARDAQFVVVFGGARSVQYTCNAELAETEGILWALQLSHIEAVRLSGLHHQYH